MNTRMSELCYKEVVSVQDGSRYGRLGDVELDADSGQIRALVVPGRRRFFGLFGREADAVFSWDSVERIGEDIILVQGGHSRRERRARHTAT